MPTIERPNFESYFTRMLSRDKEKAQRIIKILGDRIEFMEFDPEMRAKTYCWDSIVCFFLSDENGLEAAQVLARKVPECISNRKIGRKIIIKEVINPHYIPEIHEVKGTYLFTFLNSEKKVDANYPPILAKPGKDLFCSKDHVLLIEDNGKEIILYIYEDTARILIERHRKYVNDIERLYGHKISSTFPV